MAAGVVVGILPKPRMFGKEKCLCHASIREEILSWILRLLPFDIPLPESSHMRMVWQEDMQMGGVRRGKELAGSYIKESIRTG